MRNISFALTTKQVRNQTKTVTRRLGWTNLKPGTLLQPIVKGQGLKKGEHPKKIGGPIRVVDVRREKLLAMLEDPERAWREVAAEGFPMMMPGNFVSWFAQTHGIGPSLPRAMVTRIQFEYTTPARTSERRRMAPRRKARVIPKDRRKAARRHS